VHDRWANVISYGEGAPILFVHGLGGSWQNWLENIPAAGEAGYRAIAVDLPGFGASEMPAEQISISGYGRFVEALLGELGLGPVALVGNSMGGFVGAEMAIRYSTRVQRLVLVSAAGLSIEHQRHDTVLKTLRLVDDVLKMGTGWLASKSDALANRPRSRRAMFNIVAAHPGRLPGPLVAEQLRGSGKPGFVGALDAYPIRERLSQIRAPTLVVWGEDDHLVPVRDAWEFGDRIPDARVVVYEDTGHVAMLERPDAFNALVAEFMAQ
jgi:pimeloyl-ACP methyl ester carboxylesterase